MGMDSQSHKHSFILVDTQTVCVCVGESPLDLSVGALRLSVCGIQTQWNYERLGQRSRPQTQYSVYCMWVCWCIGGVMKRSRQGGRSARIIRRVMEGVHEEFRLALRENKWEGVLGVRWPEKHQFFWSKAQFQFQSSSLCLLRFDLGFWLVMVNRHYMDCLYCTTR